MSIEDNKLSKLFKAHDKDVVDKEAPLLKNTKAVQMMIIGPKRSGKTSLILSLLSHKSLYKNYFHNIFLISPSSSDGKMKQLINEIDKDGKYYKDLTESNIQTIISYIKGEQQKIKQTEKKTGKKHPPIYNLLILDDVVADLPRSFKKNIITSLFLNARHINLSTMIVSQVYKGIPSQIRKQTDIIYTFPVIESEIEAMNTDFKVPKEIFDLAFKEEDDHPFLTINVVSKNKPRYFRKFDKINI